MIVIVKGVNDLLPLLISQFLLLALSPPNPQGERKERSHERLRKCKK